MGGIYVVFDVESVGLLGEGFAVGAVVVDRSGLRLEEFEAWAPPVWAKGKDEDQLWVRRYVTPCLSCDSTQVESLREVRRQFWAFWVRWKAAGAILVADCPFPVEAKFILKCLKENTLMQIEDSPYPLLDVNTLVVTRAVGVECDQSRMRDELPAHNPLCDARQSARLWLACLPR